MDESDNQTETKTPFDPRHSVGGENWSKWNFRDSNDYATPTIAQKHKPLHSLITQTEGADRKKLLFVKNKNKIVENSIMKIYKFLCIFIFYFFVFFLRLNVLFTIRSKQFTSI